MTSVEESAATPAVSKQVWTTSTRQSPSSKRRAFDRGTLAEVADATSGTQGWGARVTTAKPEGPLPGTGAVERRLIELFQSFGLSEYKSRVLYAVLHSGSATAAELHTLSGIPRTSVYPALRELYRDGLVARVSEERGGRWTAPHPEGLVARLGGRAEDRMAEVHAERMRELEAVEQSLEGLRKRLAETRRLADEVTRKVPREPFGFIHLLQDSEVLTGLYAHLLEKAEFEVLVFNKGPFYEVRVDPRVVSMRARGVAARALWQIRDVTGAQNKVNRQVAKAYRDAGVESRCIEELPFSLAVFDRKRVLLALGDPMLEVQETPTPAHFNHPGFGRAQAEVFHHYWELGRPL